MKTLKTLVALTLAATLLFTTACQKEVAPQNASTTISTEKLVGSYKVTAMVMKATDGTEADVFTTITDCQKKDRQLLKAGNAYERINSCDPADNQTGTWNLVGTNKVIINGLAGDIVSFNGRNLVLSFPDFLGLPATMVETLTRQ